VSDASGSGESRPLLVNGEALKVDVTAPQGGGGPKFEPRTAEDARGLLLPQITSMSRAAHALPQELRAADRLYVEARLLPNYLAASYFPSALLAQIGATPVGSRADTGAYQTRSKTEMVQTRRLILTVSDDGLDELEALVNTRGRGRTQSQAFSEIRKLDEFGLPAEDRVLRTPSKAAAEPHEGTRIWEAVLHPQGARSGEPVPIDESTLARFFALIESLRGHPHRDFVRQVGGLTFTPVTLESDDDALVLARFNPLRVLRPMPAIRPRPRFGTRSGQRVSPPSSTHPVASTVTVAVFDGGVDTRGNPADLFPISTSDLTPMPADAASLDHGTGVTGAVLYGLLEEGQQAPRPALPVESFRVLPAPDTPGDLEGYWVLDRIKETVEQGRHKLVNLSLGPTLAVEDDMEPNRWTSELDQLAWETDVLFVVAAGNDGNEDRVAGLHRVQVPADMANGLSVGACDAPAPDKPWTRASYSSMGPGRHGARVQPLGVQFGGVDSRLFKVLRVDGSFLEASGTSFAAPVTMHAISDLVTRLPRVNSSILRSFVTHFAERPRQHVKLRDEVGYGRHPLSFEGALQCEPDEVHVLFADEIERGDLLGYQIPVPRAVISDLELRLTMAYASPIDPTQPTEYTSASLELLLRPHQAIHRFTPPPGLEVKGQTLDLRSSEARALLTAGWTPSQEPVTRALGAPRGSSETQLRDSGKWETVRHHRVTLRAGETEAPRLEVSYVARRAGALDNSPTKVPFAILLTIRDMSGAGTLYDVVRADHRILLPADRPRARVRVRGGSDPRWY
jgi:subtilisin family serine protease